MAECSVDGCERDTRQGGNGLCRTHYMRVWYTGEVGGGEIRPYRAAVVDLFWRNVNKRGPDDCWEWTASRSPKGYGKWKPKGQHVAPHRYSYELHKGPIPEGLTIDHLCLNKACVNPAHLEAVTNAENTRRRIVLLTHCKRGHEFTPENTDRHPISGARVCIACQQRRGREAYERLKARRAASS